jgi:carnitine-CoA ligase
MQVSIAWTTDAALSRAAALGSERIAVVLGEDGSSMSYGSLNEQATRLANALVACGVVAGERVAVFMENGFDYLIAYHGVGRAGAIFVPIVTQSKLPEVEYFIGHSEPAVLIIDAERWAIVADAIAAGKPAFASLRAAWLVGEGGPHGLARFTDVLAAAATTPPAARPVPEQPVAFMYTSGSTGRPKAVIHSHYTAIAQAEAVCARMGYTSDDRLMTVFPLFHGNALVWSALAAVWCGARVIIHRRFSASGFWASARRHGATEVNLLLGAINMLLAQAPRVDDAEHPIRLVLANVTEPIHREFTARFAVDIVSTWALAEGPLGTMTAPGHGYRAGEIGWPMGTDNEVRVVDADDVPVADGAVGELVQRNRAVMLGYYKNEAETARVLRGGWVHSGDLGYRDRNGLFYFVGRAKNIVRRAGENVSSEEVEECLQSHPAIEEAAVTAVADAIRGEEGKAHVVLRPGTLLSESAIVAWCAERLADFKIPRYIEFLDTLPRTGPLKIDRSALAVREHPTACWDRTRAACSS